jgi:hypothetical protein
MVGRKARRFRPGRRGPRRCPERREGRFLQRLHQADRLHRQLRPVVDAIAARSNERGL